MTQNTPITTPKPQPSQWRSIEDCVPTIVDDEDVPVYTWDGNTVAEDTYGPEFDQPAGPVIGGWVRTGEGFGDIHRTVTHWMPRTLPAAPGSPAQPSQDAEDAARYRWLREQPKNDTSVPRIDVVQWVAAGESCNDGESLRLETLDAAIDAVRKPQEQS